MNLSRKPVVLAASAFAVLMLALAFRQQYTTSAPNQSDPASANTAAKNSGKINWLSDLPAALAKAKENGRPIFVDFYADWCGPCKLLDAKTFSDPRVFAATTNWFMVKVDVDQKQSLAQHYNVEVLPTLLILSPEGKELGRERGFIPAERMLTFLKSATSTTSPPP